MIATAIEILSKQFKCPSFTQVIVISHFYHLKKINK